MSVRVWDDNETRNFVRHVLAEFRKETLDSVEYNFGSAIPQLKDAVLGRKFYRVLDLLELLAKDQGIACAIKEEFEAHGAAWRLDTAGSAYPFFVPCGTEEQSQAVTNAISDLRNSGFNAGEEHLKNAALAIRENRYRDSVGDSMKAIESVACHIAPGNKKTLGKALQELVNCGTLPHEFKVAIDGLWRFANAEPGIRHAGSENRISDVGPDEAVAIFGVCACFASYLCNLKAQL